MRRFAASAANRLVTVSVAIAAFAAVLWTGDVRAQSCDLAVNGSFESPNIQTQPQRAGENTAYANGWAVWRTTTYPLDGWQTVSGTVDILRHYSNASHGAQSLDLFGTAAATFRQTFTGLIPGRSYTFSIDYSGHSATQSSGIVQLGNGSGATPVTLATLRPAANSVANGNAGLPTTQQFTVTWRTFQHTFVATGTEATIQFVNTGVSGGTGTGLFIDNFAFASDGPCETELTITKNDGATTYVPGSDVTYSIVVTNGGPAPVVGARISDPLPAGITDASWVCSAAGGGACGAASGNGGIDTTANLPVGASVTYTLNLRVPASHSGSLTNTATVATPAGVADANPGNNSASDTDTMEPTPASNACSPRLVAQGATFTLAPIPVTGTVQKSAAAGWQAGAPWSTSGGNYTFTWTFSQPVPVSWLRFAVVDVNDTSGSGQYQTSPPTFTVTFGGGSTATPADFALVPPPSGGSLLWNASTGVLRFDPSSSEIRQHGFLQGINNDTVASITITSSGVTVGDNIANRLFVRPACLTVQKASEGGTGSFTIDLTNVAQADSSTVSSTTLTTTATGTPVSSPDYFSSTPGADLTLSEVVPAGWGITSATCTDQNASNTGNPTLISAFATPTLTIPAANVRPEADIVCRFDNGQLPRIDLTKTTRRVAGGPFGFALSNTTVTAPAAVTTSAADSAVAVDGDAGAGTAFTVSSFGADVTIDESSLPAGWIVDAPTTCTNAGGAVVGGLSGRTYTIPAGSIAAGQTYTCNFTNAPTTNLRIDKSATPTAVRSGESVSYTIVVNNDGPGPGDGAMLRDPPVTGVDCAAATLTCSASGGAACPAPLDVGTLQNGGLTISTLPAGGALQFGMTCTATATGQ